MFVDALTFHISVFSPLKQDMHHDISLKKLIFLYPQNASEVLLNHSLKLTQDDNRQSQNWIR